MTLYSRSLHRDRYALSFSLSLPFVTTQNVSIAITKRVSNNKMLVKRAKIAQLIKEIVNNFEICYNFNRL